MQDGLAQWHRKADGNCAVDYGFHQIIGGVDEESLKAMAYLVDNEGVTSFKLFMAYPGVFYADDGQILRAMPRDAGESGAMIMMHAENGIAIDVLVAQSLARGRHRPALRLARLDRAELEGEATNRAIQLSRVAGGSLNKVAGNVPLYIVHLSASEALEEVARGPRPWPQRVRRSTCPQYLDPSTRGSPSPARLRRRQVGVLDAVAPRSTSIIMPTSGRACGRTSWRWCPPTTARSA